MDLFDSARDPDARHRKSNIKIHEDASGSIYTTGVTSRLISSQDEVGVAWGRHGGGMAAGGPPARDVLRGDSQARGGISPEMGQSSPGVMQGEVGVPTGLQQGAVLTPQCFKVSFFPAPCRCS